jgi:hypothetical protein
MVDLLGGHRIAERGARGLEIRTALEVHELELHDRISRGSQSGSTEQLRADAPEKYGAR